MKPTISIIVPVYNVEKYLERCVQSLVNQTYPQIEIILVDDGSTDGSGELCDRLADADERISVIHKPNGGLSDARNVGIKNSKAPYILLVDSDDFIELTACEELIQIAMETDADMVSFRENKIDTATGKHIGTIPEETKTVTIMTGKEVGQHFLYGKYIQRSAWSKLYKRYLFEQLLFPVGMLAEDFATTYLYVSMCNQIACYDRALYNYCVRRNSIMTSASLKLSTDVYQISCKCYEFEKEHYPDHLKIIETSYANCLLKTLARVVNEHDCSLVPLQKEIENRLKKVDLTLVPMSTRVIYWLSLGNKKVYGWGMKLLGKNG